MLIKRETKRGEKLKMQKRSKSGKMDLVRDLEQTETPEKKAELLKAAFENGVVLRDLWNCRKYIWEVASAADGTTKPILTLQSILAMLTGKAGKAEKLIQQLPENSACRDFAELLLPSTPLNRFRDVLIDLREHHKEFPLTAMVSIVYPSIMDNFRDFSTDWAELERDPEGTEQMFCDLYGSEGHNAYIIAQAENLYQKGENLQALMQIVGVIPLLQRQDSQQLLFTAMNLETNILMMEGQIFSIRPVLTALQNLIPEVKQEDWTSNLEAIEVLINLYNGDCQRATQWLNLSSPNEYEGYCVLDTYQYLLKLRVYLLQKKFLAFRSLASKMLFYAQVNHRELEKCQILLLWAMCDRASGDEESALVHLEEGLKLAEKYQYNRLVANEGLQMLRLLQAYRKADEQSPYLERLIAMTRKTASLYPRYLCREDPELGKLSHKELEVLRFLADGRRNAEIAQLMDVKIDTIKAHCKHINQKLKTQNRQQAVRRAMELGILKQIGMD